MHIHRTVALLYAFIVLIPLTGFAAESLTFEKDVRPIMKAHCFHCHGESGVKEGMLDVRLRHWILAGGDSGEAIQPGEPDESLLFERVVSGDMPPGDKNLSDADIATLREWIVQGAKTARDEPESLDDGDYITEEERDFWSFQPIVRPDVPQFENQTVDNPIDAFILKRLKQEGLSFSATADRYTLIRRLTFDLWGLPPEPEMVDQFIHDPSPDAYANLVDRLLSSPRYGERWGRHWLDVAGYADSDGYTNRDIEREFAYFYRDYVIDSFNDDKPLDQFVREQLAGDELDAEAGGSDSMTPERMARLAATGFLRMAADGTGSGGIDRDLAVNTTIADTIDIVSTSLLGLTVGCARCHDHRHDPISQADYHRFRAIFDPALDWKKWKAPMQRRVSMYTDEDKRLRAAVEERAKEATAARNQRQQEHIDRTLYEELLVVPDEVREQLKAAYQTEKAKRTPEQIALLEEYPSVGNITPGSLYLYAQQRARRAGDIEKAAAERESRYIAEAQQQQLAKVPAEKRGAVEALIAVAPESRTEAQQALAAEYPEVFVTAESLATINAERFAELKRYRDAAAICRATDAKTELAEMQAGIVEIRSTAPKEKFLRVLTEPANHTPDSHLFIRGDHKQLGQKLPPDELTVLKSFTPVKIEVNDPNRPTTGRRLAYARHLTNGKHPLLARVLMNRVWLHHFGHGIVDTPGDFGYLGAKPTHPELLDWLADELMRGGWSLKRMHRMILLTTTYTQDSLRSEELDRIDPDNRLYARMSIRRLESEAIRDAVLLASGVMTDTLHGPPVPVKEDAVGQIVLGEQKLDGERKPTGEDKDFEGLSRRSIYVQVRRSRPLAVLEAFDIATVAPNCTQRNFSNVAPQSLLMMNSQFAIEHAEKLADRLIQADSEVSQQLSLAWKHCFGKTIENSVLVELMEFVDQQTSVFRARDAKLAPEAAHRLALATACQAMFSSNEFLYVD
ncbi:Planctomycete cytochrome C [Novipirellula galeiformis]|uniref:Planctomycete cytochrome C n=1 Tax=Novipirellula galeiformis TaxID=2528004 RepID=A0A5C6BZL8_9BACT|nr:DUF1553 domain-containing protein [Novipirellula galeiformis]TWU17302.1 Planctomycete cytochrome C [Novipirellula galeiformis]